MVLQSPVEFKVQGKGFGAWRVHEVEDTQFRDEALGFGDVKRAQHLKRGEALPVHNNQHATRSKLQPLHRCRPCPHRPTAWEADVRSAV